MKNSRDYIQEIGEIHAMMERSSKFLSLSGWAGVMVGVYALTGSFIAYEVFDFNPEVVFEYPAMTNYGIRNIISLALVVLGLSIITAIFFSRRQARKRGEKIWSATSRRLMFHMAIPLSVGGITLLILVSKGLVGLIAPFSLVFYGLALYNASKFTYEEVRVLGVIQMVMGLMGAYFVEYGMLFWALGFGVVHIIYGVYMHLRYDR